MQAIFDQMTQLIGGYVPNLIGALLILIIGWIVALVIAAIVRGVVRKTKLSNRLARWVWGEEEAKAVDAERWVGKGVFYIVMLFVLIAFFQALNLTIITEPLNRLLTQVFQFFPQLLAAGLLLLVAWIVASVLRWILSRVLTAAKLDERFGGQAGLEAERRISLTKSIADAVYWLVFLLFLPAVLSALEMKGILEPVQGMLSKILGFLPNLFVAGLILVIGWFLARIVQRIVTNLLAAVGTDRLSDKVGLAPVLGTKQLSWVVGFIVYVLILIPVLIATLNALELESITKPASDMLNLILAALPAIFAAALVVAIAYVVGRVVSRLITNVLTTVGFNGVLARLGIGKDVSEGKSTPSAIVGYLVLIAIMLFAVIEALDLLEFESLSDIVSDFMVFAGHVLLGLIIFGIGLFVANVASKAIMATGKAQAGLLSRATQIAIIVIVAAIALRQMGLANEIINLAFGLLLGAVAVAVAIAFGIGGRELAARQLDEWVKSKKS